MQEVSPSYDTALVVASFLISALGAYCALAAMALVRGRDGRVSKLNAVFAGLALGGVGIWSMHFLGMMAWSIDAPTGYEPMETAFSLLLAVGASVLALGYMAAGPFTLRRLLVAGPLAGLGVAGMHFVGMGSMRFAGTLQWNFGLVVLSVVIAVVAATAALWLAFAVRGRSHRVGAAFVMASAVSLMHYTGMAAADVLCSTGDRTIGLPGLLYRSDLMTMVVSVALAVVAIMGIDVFFQRVLRATEQPSG